MTTAIMFPSQIEVDKLKNIVITIVSPETELEAREYLTRVRLASKNLEKDIKAMKAPYQTAIKDIDDAAKPWKSSLAERDQALERALLDYGRKVREAAEKANVKIMDKYEDKVAHTEAKAIAAGKPIPLVLPPQLVSTPQKSVNVEGVKQTIVKRKAWRMKPGGFNAEMNLKQLFEMAGKTGLNEWWPDNIPGPEHFFLDTAQIGKVVRAGGTIPGIEVFEEESIAVRG